VLPAATVVSEVANHLLAAVPFENGRHAEPLAVISIFLLAKKS
jgi:hypothetical protein